MDRKRIYIKGVDPQNVSVDFAFDWEIINVLRVIPSRRYIAATKENRIARKDIPLLKERLSRYHFVEAEMPKTKHTITINSDGFNVTPEIEPFNAKLSRILFLKRPRDGYELARILRDNGYPVRVIDERESIPVELPSEPTLYPYQEECMEFLRGNDYTALVTLDMGLGKTIVACKSIKELGLGPVLIVAPSSLLLQWKGELIKHFGYDNVTIVTSKLKKDKRVEAFNNGELIITNYELLRTVPVERHFELLILDECQRVKNWKTAAAQAISRIVAKRVIGLSGTPVENNIMELYNITDQIRPAFFGTQKKFYNRYVNPYGEMQNLNEVYDRLTPLMYRKGKEEVADQLPTLTTQIREVPLTTKENKGYWDMMQACYDDGRGILGAIANAKVFASSSALRMEDIKLSSKEKELVDIVNELDEKMLIFSQYKREVGRLQDILLEKAPGREVFSMSGDTKKEGRDQAVQNFTNSDKGILLMTEVGTHGLNLQTASVCINMDLPWTYARLDQRIGRIQRLGSEHDKNLLINLISSETIDEHIMDIIDRKKELFDLTINGAKRYVAEAFEGDLRAHGINFDSFDEVLAEVE